METLELVLADHPFFAGMEARHLQVLASCGSNVRVNAGDLLFREGEPANHFYLLRHGRVGLEIFNLERGPISIQTVAAGDVLGWSWLVPPHNWRFDARAIELVRATALDGECLRRKCETDHELGFELMRRLATIMAQRLEATRLQLLDIYGVKR